MTSVFDHTYRRSPMDISSLDGATRIVLDVHPGAQPIHGCLRPGTGLPEPFTGWLELTLALERLISAAAQPVVLPQDHRAL